MLGVIALEELLEESLVVLGEALWPSVLEAGMEGMFSGTLAPKELVVLAAS